MRTIYELIEFMDWPGDVNYEELIKQKQINHDPDLFFSIQGDAIHLYAEAKDVFSRDKMTLEELFSLQEYLLEGLWR